MIVSKTSALVTGVAEDRVGGECWVTRDQLPNMVGREGTEKTFHVGFPEPWKVPWRVSEGIVFLS